jgi:hypothetical protein
MRRIGNLVWQIVPAQTVVANWAVASQIKIKIKVPIRTFIRKPIICIYMNNGNICRPGNIGLKN